MSNARWRTIIENQKVIFIVTKQIPTDCNVRVSFLNAGAGTVVYDIEIDTGFGHTITKHVYKNMTPEIDILRLRHAVDSIGPILWTLCNPFKTLRMQLMQEWDAFQDGTFDAIVRIYNL